MREIMEMVFANGRLFSDSLTISRIKLGQIIS